MGWMRNATTCRSALTVQLNYSTKPSANSKSLVCIMKINGISSHQHMCLKSGSKMAEHSYLLEKAQLGERIVQATFEIY